MRLIDPMKWKAMKDYQRGWYWQLMLKMTYMTPYGRLPFDGQLWILAGAHSKQYWDANAGLVLASFKIAEIDGRTWIVHENLISVIKEHKPSSQSKQKKRAYAVSSLDGKTLGILVSIFDSFYSKYPRKIQKKQASKSFIKASLEHAREHKCSATDSGEFIATRADEFSAVLTRAHADKKFIPYPATWLNRGGFMDDPSEWAVQAAFTTNGSNGNGNGQHTSKADRKAADISATTDRVFGSPRAVSEDPANRLPDPTRRG
jgi:hypothetical protein